MRPSSRPPHARTARRGLVGLLAACVLVLASACTADGDEAPTPGATDASADAPAAGEPDEAPVDDLAARVIAEHTVDTPVGHEVAGGTLTLTLRDVSVDDAVLTVRWALRWDAPDRGDDEAMSLFALGVEPTPVVTDTTHLQAYMPLCTQGTWNSLGPERGQCRGTMLASPISTTSTRIANHATLEGWAALPAPEQPGGSLDVLVADGLPVFTGVTATQVP